MATVAHAAILTLSFSSVHIRSQHIPVWLSIHQRLSEHFESGVKLSKTETYSTNTVQILEVVIIYTCTKNTLYFHP